jgi:hypothetical protein
MKGFVGVTDNDWFAFLSQHPGIYEVNFWQAGIADDLIVIEHLAHILTINLGLDDET